MAIEIDLEGKKPFEDKPRTLLERTLTVGEVIKINWFESTKKKKDANGVESTIPVSKVVWTIKVPAGEVCGFYPMNIKKGQTPQYNTVLYTNLDNLGLIPKFNDIKSAVKNEEDLVEWLKQELLGKQLKFVPETITPLDGKNKYSVIKIVEGFA
jgi:hypothetical protein